MLSHHYIITSRGLRTSFLKSIKHPSIPPPKNDRKVVFRHRCCVALRHSSIQAYGGPRKTKSATLTLSLARHKSQPRL